MVTKYCLDCEKKQTCKKICKPLELHIQGDVESKGHERLFTGAFIDHNFSNENSYKNLASPSIENIILKMYFLERVPQANIAKKLNYSHQFISQVVLKYKGIIKKTLAKTA